MVIVNMRPAIAAVMALPADVRQRTGPCADGPKLHIALGGAPRAALEMFIPAIPGLAQSVKLPTLAGAAALPVGKGEPDRNRGSLAWGEAMDEFEILRVITLMRRSKIAFDGIMPCTDDRPVWNIVSHLIEAEFRGQVVTITSLSSVTGLPYATARRFIKTLIGKGLIVKEARSASGKSYSLHPSDELTAAFDRYVRAIKSIVADTIGVRDPRTGVNEYYFGGVRAAQFVPPHSLARAVSAGGELKFLLNDDPFFTSLRNLWTDFRSDLGSASSFRMCRGPDTRRELIENRRREVSHYDIVSVDLAWLGELAESGVLQPVADLLDQSEYAQSVADADLRALGQWNGDTYGVPIYCSVNTFLARSDLFAEAGLNYPTTFDEVIRCGQRLARDGCDGIVWDAARGAPVAQSFMALMPAAGGSPLSVRGALGPLARRRLDEGELAAIIASEAGRRALDFMHRLVGISPPDILSLAWDDSLERFMSGGAAMGYMWSMRATRLEYDLKSAVRQRVKYLSQPVAFGGTRASALSGFLLAIPANLPRERARMAIEAIGWLISAEASDAPSQQNLPVAPRFAVGANPDRKAGSRTLNFMQDLAVKGLLHIQHRPLTPHFPMIEEILGDEIHAALRGDKPDACALAEAARRIEALGTLEQAGGTPYDTPEGPVTAEDPVASNPARRESGRA